MLPSSILDGTLNMHFLGFSFHQKSIKGLESLVEVIDQAKATLVFTTTSSTYASMR
jgi:hypothetical protein